MSQKSGAGYEEEGDKAFDMMIKAGIEVINLPPDETEKWKSAVRPLWEEFITKNEALGLPAKELVRELQELTQKYSRWTPEQMMKQVKDNPTRGIIDGM